MIKSEATKMKRPLKTHGLSSKKHFDLKTIPFRHLVYAILLLNLLMIVLVIFYSRLLPPQVPLLYGLPRGEAQLTQPILLILPITISSLFLLLNTTFAVFTKSDFLKNALVASGLFVSILSLITVIRIITAVVVVLK